MRLIHVLAALPSTQRTRRMRLNERSTLDNLRASGFGDLPRHPALRSPQRRRARWHADHGPLWWARSSSAPKTASASVPTNRVLRKIAPPAALSYITLCLTWQMGPDSKGNSSYYSGDIRQPHRRDREWRLGWRHPHRGLGRAYEIGPK